jgi:hypothetical protein
MKKISIKIVVVILSIMTLNINAQGIFRVSGGSAQIGYQNYRWLGLGFNSSSPTSNQSQWGIEHYASGLNFWKPWPSFNNGNFKLHISDYGHVSIGNPANPWFQKTAGSWPFQYQVQNFKLQVHGNVVAIGGNYFTHSDSAAKENMTNLPENTLSKLLQLVPLKYNYKQNFNIGGYDVDTAILDSSITGKSFSLNPNNDTSLHFGFTAQAISRLFPNLVSGIGNSEAVNYIEFIPIIVRGIQDQQKVIDSQRLEIAQLRQEIINWQGRSIDTIGQSRSRLFQNSPNPFDGTTTITYFIDESTPVTSATIEVRNIMGTLQSTIVLNDGTGIGSTEYNGSNLSPGYYIYTLKINGSIKDSKMFLKEN